MELSSSNIKNFLYFRKRNRALSDLSPQYFSLKNFLYFFLKNPALNKFLIFSQNKAFLIFSEMEPCIFESKIKK